MNLEITVIAEVKKEVEINVHLDDVINKMNEINMVARWNYVAKILNGLNVDDINSLSNEQKKTVGSYLSKQSVRFLSELDNV
jgi:hypothetical protein